MREAQRDEGALAERAEVEHPRVGIEGMEVRQRLAGVAELAVVVVLHQPRVARRRPVEKREAPLEAQRDARRVLVRGVT